MQKISRRCLLKTGGVLAASSLLSTTVFGNVRGDTVRDRLWIWGHLEGSYDNAYGLPANSSMTPLQGAASLGIPNIIMVRYGGKPVMPFDRYAEQYSNTKKLMWSFVGDASSGTSSEEQEHVLELAKKMPNITGLFMDDFFHGDATPRITGARCWLAENNVSLPVLVTFRFEKPVEVNRVELVQTAWKTGDYRTSDVVVETLDGTDWKELGILCLENSENAVASLTISNCKDIKVFRLRIIGTHDTSGARSVGLGGIRLFNGNKQIDLSNVEVEASSSYTGHPPETLLSDGGEPEAAASISVARLQKIREKVERLGRNCDIGVTLYTHQLNPIIRKHLDLCDVVSFWSWTADDLAKLEVNFAKYRQLVPGKRTLLGIYMWDFGLNKPLPMDLMKMQCDTALKWLKQGEIEGMIFLATNICDMKIEAVEYSRKWIAEHGNETV